MSLASQSQFERAHFVLLFVFLVGTGLAKLIGALGDATAPDALDPVFAVSTRVVLVVVGLVELAIAACLLIGHRSKGKHLVILWLSSSFLAYRIAAWWLSGANACPCLGTLARSEGVLNGVLGASVAYMLLTSVYFLARDPLTAAVARLSNKGYRRLKVVLTVVLGVAAVPPLQVILTTVFNPPTTGPIIVRAVGQSVGGGESSPIVWEWVDIEEVPPFVLQLLLSAEDNRFLSHRGFAWDGIWFSLREARRTGNQPRGMSTITQQCARSTFLWQGRSWVRKGIEAYYTFWMELFMSKKRILELYVNVIELGDGIYGLEAGAQYHYGTSLSQLTPEEAANLVTILPSPKTLDPKQLDGPASHRSQAVLRGASQLSLPKM